MIDSDDCVTQLPRHSIHWKNANRRTKQRHEKWNLIISSLAWSSSQFRLLWGSQWAAGKCRQSRRMWYYSKLRMETRTLEHAKSENSHSLIGIGEGRRNLDLQPLRSWRKFKIFFVRFCVHKSLSLPGVQRQEGKFHFSDMNCSRHATQLPSMAQVKLVNNWDSTTCLVN